MSAIAGIFGRTSTNLDLESLGRVAAGLESVGPDDNRSCCRGPVAMVHRPFFTRQQSPRQRQPLVVDDGTVISFDGRLDATAASRDSGGQSEWDDASIVLAVYRTHGVRGFSDLIGDFAFSLWDPQAQQVVLCCDALARRPLYYALSNDRLIWSSRARPLAQSGMLNCEIDSNYIADFLGSWTPEGSPFTGIRAVPAGHALCVTRSTARTIRYWAPDPTATIRYKSDREYEDHFLELFKSAVACRLAADAPVWCELSGGVDSASIACCADETLRARGSARSSLRTLSYVYDDARTSDERRFITPIESQLQRGGLHLSERECPILTPLPTEFQPDVPSNGLCFLSRADRVAHEMAATGARVLLNGIGGDQLFWSEAPAGLELADLLASGRFVRLLQVCHQLSVEKRTAFLRMLWSVGVRPLLPRRIQAQTDFDHPLAPWFNRDFVRKTGLGERTLPMRDNLGFMLPTKRAQYGYVRQTMRPFAVEWCSSAGYVDLRYPYMDRRLVDFALALPLEQSVRPGETRSIVRRSLRGIVPDEVRLRTSKGGPNEAFHRALVAQWPWLTRIFAKPLVAEYGFVDYKPLREAMDQARHGRTRSPVQLIRTIALELWLRTLAQHSEAGKAATAPSGRRHTIQGETYENITRYDL
jgi:asparagine synthase (glutamine-hydrolysing)